MNLHLEAEYETVDEFLQFTIIRPSYLLNRSQACYCLTFSISVSAIFAD
jgi:hypothetical protein